jgi:hypothetical protein
MRCVHCHKPLTKKSKDHVFPKSWYPDSTPPNVQRWTVPSCADCNRKFWQLERELLIRLGLCIEPTKAEASGLSHRALQSIGLRTSELSEKEKRHRAALKSKMLKQISRHKPGSKPLPGLGPHHGFPLEQQIAIRIPQKVLAEVAKKIIRGCEYILGGKRLIEKPFSVDVYFPDEAHVENLRRMVERSTSARYLGPGFEIRRAEAHDKPGMMVYRVVIWGTLIIYGAITDSTQQ